MSRVNSPEGLRDFLETHAPRWLPVASLREVEGSPTAVRVIFELGRRYEQMCAAEHLAHKRASVRMAAALLATSKDAEQCMSRARTILKEWEAEDGETSAGPCCNVPPLCTPSLCSCLCDPCVDGAVRGDRGHVVPALVAKKGGA